MSDEHVLHLYMEKSSIVLAETSPSRSGYVYRRTVQLLKRFPYRFAMFHGRYGVVKTFRTLNKTLQKRVHVGFLFSLLHVLKMKFKGSGRFSKCIAFGVTITS